MPALILSLLLSPDFATAPCPRPRKAAGTHRGAETPLDNQALSQGRESDAKSFWREGSKSSRYDVMMHRVSRVPSTSFMNLNARRGVGFF